MRYAIGPPSSTGSGAAAISSVNSGAVTITATIAGRQRGETGRPSGNSSSARGRQRPMAQGQL